MKKGFICGVFDLFHYGHILGFRECRKYCDFLIVAVNKAENIDPKINPGKWAPVFPLEHRIQLLRECRLVDEVLVYNSEQELNELLITGKYNVRFLGDDYIGKPITGIELTDEVIFLDRSHGLSSSNFKEQLLKKTS